MLRIKYGQSEALPTVLSIALALPQFLIVKAVQSSPETLKWRCVVHENCLVAAFFFFFRRGNLAPTFHTEGGWGDGKGGFRFHRLAGQGPERGFDPQTSQEHVLC